MSYEIGWDEHNPDKHDELCFWTRPCDAKIGTPHRVRSGRTTTMFQRCAACGYVCECPVIGIAREHERELVAKRVKDYLQHDVADGWMPQCKADGIVDLITRRKP